MAYADEDYLYQDSPPTEYGNPGRYNPEPYVEPPPLPAPRSRVYIGGMDEVSPITPPGQQTYSNGWSPGATPEGIAMVQSRIAAAQQLMQDEALQKEARTAAEAAKNTEEELKAIQMAQQFQAMRGYHNDVANGVPEETAATRWLPLMYASSSGGGSGSGSRGSLGGLAALERMNSPLYMKGADGQIVALPRRWEGGVPGKAPEPTVVSPPRAPGKLTMEPLSDGRIKVTKVSPTGNPSIQILPADDRLKLLQREMESARAAAAKTALEVEKQPGQPGQMQTNAPAWTNKFTGAIHPQQTSVLPPSQKYESANRAREEAERMYRDAWDAYADYLEKMTGGRPEAPKELEGQAPQSGAAPVTPPAPTNRAVVPAPTAAAKAVGRISVKDPKDPMHKRYTIPDTPEQRAIARAKGYTDANGQPL